MVNVTRRQAAPFQALLNMIKINYMTKPEVFQTLIAILCDYDQNNADNIVKTIRYIHVLLTRNPDLADCLISFLPEPGSLASGESSAPKNVVSDYKTSSDVLTRPPAGIYHSIPGLKQMISTSKEWRGSWSLPTVKESLHNTSFTVSTTQCDIKMITATQLGFDEVSPHIRPLMVPQPGGAANHFHVVKQESGTLPADSVFTAMNTSSFPRPLTSINIPFKQSDLPRENTISSAKEMISFDNWAKPFDPSRPMHPLLQSTSPICSIKQETCPFEGKSILSRPSPLGPGPCPTSNVSLPLALGIISPMSETHQARSWGSPETFAKPLAHVARSGIRPSLPSVINTMYPNKHLGLKLPLNKLLYEGNRSSDIRSDLSHLVKVTNASSTTLVHQDGGFNQTSPLRDQLSAPPRFQFHHHAESLKELTTKLKVAEQSMKQSHYARFNPVAEGEGSLRYRMTGGRQFKDSSQLSPEQNTMKSIKPSFSYVQRIILPDGCISSFKVDEYSKNSESELLRRPSKKPTKHVLKGKCNKVKLKKRKHKKVKLKTDERTS